MRLLPGKGAIRLPLFITRQFLYGFILFTAIVLVILPLSILTYLNFYRMLIPTERIQVPTKFMVGEHKLEYSVVDSLAVLPFLRLNQDLTFRIRLNFHAICTQRWEKEFHSLKYKFHMAENSVISDNFLVNCDLRYIYVEKNRLVPYNLRYWVPPILVDIHEMVQVDWPLTYMKGSELVPLLEKMDPIFEFESIWLFLVDSHKTTIDFVVEWDGIRYYMVNYYITSFIIGVGGFWIFSSWVCVLSSLIFLSYFLSDSAKPAGNPLKKDGTTALKTERIMTIKQENGE